MTADTLGGVYPYALDVAWALQPYGVHVALATFGAPPSKAQQAAAWALPNVTLHPSAYKLEWMTDPWDDLAAAGDVLLALRDAVQPDLVHLNHYAHGALDWGVPVLVVGHSCVCSWWEAVHGEAAPAVWDRYRAVVQQGLQAAHAVAAPTRAMLAALQRHYGPLPPAYVVPNGRAARRYRVEVKERVVLAAGRLWDAGKGIDTLAAVASDLSAPVRVAGPTEHPDGGRAAYPNVTWLGMLEADDLAAAMARAAIYALPARYEPFGLSAVEAGLSGCALVLGDIPSLREVWGDAALYVRDADALRTTLQRLLADDGLRAAYGARAYARAITYTPDRTARDLLALYHRLLACPTTRRAA